MSVSFSTIISLAPVITIVLVSALVAFVLARGTILRMQLGIPIVTCGPGHRLIPHQADEYVEVSELVDAAKIYVASVLNFLK